MQLSEKDGWHLPKPDERRDRLAAARVLERELDHLHRPSPRRAAVLETRRLCLTMTINLAGLELARRLDRRRGVAVQRDARMTFALERSA